MNKAMLSVLLEYKVENVFGFLTSYESQNLLYNNQTIIQEKIFMRSLLSKQIIFVLFHSDLMKHGIPSHYY